MAWLPRQLQKKRIINIPINFPFSGISIKDKRLENYNSYYDDENCSVTDNDYNRIAYVYLIQVFMYLFYCKIMYLQIAWLMCDWMMPVG